MLHATGHPHTKGAKETQVHSIKRFLSRSEPHIGVDSLGFTSVKPGYLAACHVSELFCRTVHPWGFFAGRVMRASADLAFMVRCFPTDVDSVLLRSGI